MAAFSWCGSARNVDCLNSGPLPLILPLLDRLDFQGILDRLIPHDSQRDYTHGQVLRALCAARLCKPSALVNVENWADESGYQYLGGLPADKLNDDRLARALDAFFDVRHSAMAALTARCLECAELSLQRLHFDPTVVPLTGSYESSLPRPDLLLNDAPMPSDAALEPAHLCHHHETDAIAFQIGQVAVVDALGALPVFAHVLDGNRNHHPAIHQTFELLRQHLPLPPKMRLISDRGTFSEEHLVRLHRHGYEIICAAKWCEFCSFYEDQADELVWHSASFLSVEQQRRRRVQSDLPHEHYELAVREHHVLDPTNQENIPARLIFVYSTADERQCRQHRQEQIANLQAGLTGLQARLSRGHPRCTAKTITQQVLKLLGKKEAARYFRWEIRELTATERAALPQPAKGHQRARHSLEFHFDADAARAAEAYDGLSVLVTTAAAEVSADQLFTEYKQQAYVELLHHQNKTPLAVSPIFLKTPQRVEALVCLLQLALQAYQMLERLYRQQTPAPAPPQEKRMTAERLMRAFQNYGLAVRGIDQGEVVEASRLTTRQRDILNRLGFATPRQLLRQQLPPEPAHPPG